MAEEHRFGDKYKGVRKKLFILRNHKGSASQAGYVYEKMGHDRFARKVELMRKRSNQFFGDIKENAYEFAGKDGFVVELNIEDSIARTHSEGQQMMSGSMIVENFVFSAKELSEFVREGKTVIHDIARERETEQRGEGVRKELEPPPGFNEGNFGSRR